MWNGIPCPLGQCDLTLATPIEVEAQEIVSIRFTVTEKGSVEGFVRAADGKGLGPQPARVEIYRPSGEYFDSGRTDSDGRFEVSGVPEGDYYVLAEHENFRTEVYDDVPCNPGTICDPTAGQSVAVSNGSATRGVDFRLNRLGAFEGRVLSELTGEPISNVTVSLIQAPTPVGEPVFYRSDRTGSDGAFRIEAIPPQEFYLKATSSVWEDEVFGDVPCEPSCDETLGVAVTASLDTVVTGLVFELNRTAWIEGSVRDEATGLPVSGHVQLFDHEGQRLRTRPASGGLYRFEGLEDGTYYLAAEGREDYVTELFGGECGAAQARDCDALDGTPVVVSVDQGAIVDFDLRLGGVIEGEVTDAQGNPLDSWVHAFDAAGSLWDSVQTSSDQTRFHLGGLPTGSYHLVTEDSGHIDELWPDEPCFGTPVPACQLSDGVPIMLQEGQVVKGVDFVLAELGILRGELVDDLTGDRLHGSVGLYRADGTLVDRSGSEFVFENVRPGDYRLLSSVSSLSPYLDQVYGGELCDPSCDLVTGTLIPVGLGEVVSGLRFGLQMGPGITGRVIHGPTGEPVAGVAVDAWWSFGILRESTATDADGWYRLPLDPGTYYLSTHNDAGFVDVLYGGVECPDGSAWEGFCDPTDGTPYEVEYYTPLQRLDFAFGDATVFSDGFEAGLGAWSSAVGAN